MCRGSEEKKNKEPMYGGKAAWQQGVRVCVCRRREERGEGGSSICQRALVKWTSLGSTPVSCQENKSIV